MIKNGGLDNINIEEFLGKLGIGPRHLTRLFQTHLGTTPSRVAKTARVQKTKKLIDETDLSKHDIAAKAGFKSPRPACDTTNCCRKPR